MSEVERSSCCRVWWRAAALALLVLSTSCAGQQVRGGDPNSPEGIFVRQTVQAMAEALAAADADRLLAKVSEGYYRGFTPLEKRVRALLASRSAIEIRAEVTEVGFDEPRVTVQVRWSASWINRATGNRETGSGNDRLVFMKGLGLKLIDQTGESLLGF